MHDTDLEKKIRRIGHVLDCDPFCFIRDLVGFVDILVHVAISGKWLNLAVELFHRDVIVNCVPAIRLCDVQIVDFQLKI